MAKIRTVSFLISKFRALIQVGATVLSNIHIGNFFKGQVYKGSAKAICVPGLNCYSCPGATGACPIGAIQSVVGSSGFNITYYIIGFLILIGMFLGRFICGFLCPFGLFQDLLHKIPSAKISTEKVKSLKLMKYFILFGTVILLPTIIVNETGLGEPIFCQYICPQGILEAGIPLAIANEGIRATLGFLFSLKFAILMAVVILSIFIYRPFCKFICPLGAFYAFFNKVSLFGMKVNERACTSCGKCRKACKMDVDVTKTPNHTECIRCGECVKACPTDAVSFRYGFEYKARGIKRKGDA